MDVLKNEGPRWVLTVFVPCGVVLKADALAALFIEHHLLLLQKTLARDDAEFRFELQAGECVEYTLCGSLENAENFRAAARLFGEECGVDLVFQTALLRYARYRLVCFDMDSTLIQTEVIDELARYAGVGEQVAAVTAAAMNGELDFCQSLRQRVSLLRGMSAAVMEEIARNLPLMPGAERLLATLQRQGYRLVILSGGFTYFARNLQQRFGLTSVFANELEVQEGLLTGAVVGEIVDGTVKERRLRELALKSGIGLDQVVAVGDGANDLPMLKTAGMGIAFHAKPVVRAEARQVISYVGLDALLYLLGKGELSEKAVYTS